MCCSGFVKLVAILFNACIFFAGAALLGLGVWVKVDSGSLLDALNELPEKPSGLPHLTYASTLVITLGSVLLVIGFLGCCGAMGESRCMLLTFFSIVLIIFIIKVAGAVVLLVFRNLAVELQQSLKEGFVSSIKKDYGTDKSMTSLWDSTMIKFSCCGYKNYTNFEGSPFHTNGSLFPSACCRPITATCSEDNAKLSAVTGCYKKVLKLIENNAMAVVGVTLGIFSLEIAAMVVSLVLYDDIGHKARVRIRHETSTS